MKRDAITTLLHAEMPKMLTKKRACSERLLQVGTLQLSLPCVSTPLMEYTVGGKYRLEEEIANGGCGKYTTLTAWPISDAWFNFRHRFLGRPHCRWQGGCNQTGACSDKEQPSEARIQDIQDSYGRHRGSMDYVVREKRRLQRPRYRSPGTLS